MKIYKRTISAILILLAFGLILLPQHIADRDTLYQISILNGLLQGDYDGRVSLREIRSHGDFGIGTFDRLDGEAIELDGVFYQVKSDGKVTRMAGGVRSPFAMTTFFDIDRQFPLSRQADYPSLQKFINDRLPTKNIPYAIRIDGKFGRVMVRSVHAQNKPYPVFSEVAKEQSVFEYREIEGTLVGFRIPGYMQGVNLPGYHMHFISRDKTKGGHLLECEISEGQVKVDYIERFMIALPASKAFYDIDLSAGAERSLKYE